MLRRSLLGLMFAGSLAGCGSPRTGTPAGTEASTPGGAQELIGSAQADGAGAGDVARAATADDYRWFTGERDLSLGFSFVWIRDVTPAQVIDRLGAEPLEQVYWRQLISGGDGQDEPADRRFFGVSRIARPWVLVVEDNDTLGTTDALLTPLSRGTTVVSHHRSAAGAGRLLVLRNGRVDLDMAPLTAVPKRGARVAELTPMLRESGFGATNDPVRCTLAAFAMTERLTGVAMTAELLSTKTYLLSSAPRA